MRIAKLQTCIVGVSSITNWFHIKIFDEEERVGYGEATLDGFEPAMEATVAQLSPKLVGSEIASIPGFVASIGIEDTPGGLVHAAVLSAVEMALWDLSGKQHGISVERMLGSFQTQKLRLYANINRALIRDRSVSAFASMASQAVEAGFQAVKCAPFHHLHRTDLSNREHRRQVAEGLERLRAIRRAVGDGVDLMVDCHFRFTRRSAPPIIEEIGALNPFWVEAPVAEHRLEEWAEIRGSTQLRLAGGEMMTGVQRFSRFIDATGVDVVQPDIKYVGGVSGLREIAALAASRGVSVAPHNPSGPVATVASAHASVGLDNVSILEYAFGECDWRSKLVGGGEIVEAGYLRTTDRPGFGVELDRSISEDRPYRAVPGWDLRRYG